MEKTLGQFIKELRESKQLTQLQVSKYLGYELPQTISLYESDRQKLPIFKVPELAQVLEVDPGEFFKFYSEKEKERLASLYLSSLNNEVKEKLAKHFEKIKKNSQKILDLDIKKLIPTDGKPLDYLEKHFKRVEEFVTIRYIGEVPCGPLTDLAESQIEYIQVPKMIVRGYTDVVATKAKGDSMTGDGIESGSTVFFTPAAQVENGNLAIVCDPSGATLKRVQIFGDSVLLKPSNPKYTESLLPLKEYRQLRVYKVIAVLREF